MTNKCEICGLLVSRFSLNDHLRGITDRAYRGKGAWLLTLNTEMIARCARDPEYLSLLKEADIITADGMPLVWASSIKRSGAAIHGRTTGVDLVDGFLRLPQPPSYAIIGGINPAATVALYGNAAQQSCRYLFDGKVDLSDAQVKQFVIALREQRVRLVFLALNVPKGDYLAFTIKSSMPEVVIMSIGGSFEILGPRGSRAPKWMQRGGLEWFYRLALDPGRLWRRYLLNYPRGIWFLVKDCLVSRK